MNKSIVTGLLVLMTLVPSIAAQTGEAKPVPTPDRVVVTNNMPPAQPARTPTPLPKSGMVPVTGTPTQPSQASNLNYTGLNFSEIKSRIAEARRQMQTRPLTIALAEPLAAMSPVRIAYYDWREKKVEYIVISKDAFLTANSPTAAISSNGRSVTSTTIRANGVNTPLVIKDENGQPQLPLLVQYPVEKGGRFVETAYYMSAHPGLVTPEVVSAGRFYVHNVIELAREQLRAKGYLIQPKIADIAERLSTVEHVDHLRFRTEFHPNIYNDIFTLYALNEGQTYRYSVSSAGAGGMVQMIPPTYRLMRQRFPNAVLMPDFVEGMRNHVNATQAMLLYMQMTWNDLAANPTVQNALATGIASQEHLMAAGYNSNPSKLPGYIARGGANWATLIPRETRIYLQIWDSLERAVALQQRRV
ncbi:MAG: hypothetical protein ABR530_03060 [Pyrinomonadaceae bacterium]